MMSGCGLFRYDLTRGLKPFETGYCVFIGLNPSTADALKDDPTIRRCVKFALRERCSRLVMLNLYAFRATDPKFLKYCGYQVGPENDRIIAHYMSIAKVAIAAWGVNAEPERAKAVLQAHPNLMCLGTTKEGHPRHPLYVRADAELVPFMEQT